jgi:hypothetical protein
MHLLQPTGIPMPLLFGTTAIEHWPAMVMEHLGLTDCRSSEASLGRFGGGQETSLGSKGRPVSGGRHSAMRRTLDRVSVLKRSAHGCLEHGRGDAAALERAITYSRLEARRDDGMDADDPGLLALKQQDG